MSAADDEKRLLAAFEILDRQLLDSEGMPCGKVDDLQLDFLPGDDPRSDGPVVTHILTNPGALANRLSRPTKAIVRTVWSVLRPDEDPQPQAIPWKAVHKLDYAIHLGIHRDEAGLMRSENWVRRNIIGRIPGASS